jgi:hypothetical protein
VFRGYRAASGPRGRVEYHFGWLSRRPMHATFDPRRGVLTFVSLLPDIDPRSVLAAELREMVAVRTTRRLPLHKRMDARRARVFCSIRSRHWSLVVQVRGANHEYAVRKALNLINELFVLLHERYPEYLIEHFGMSTE